MIGGLIPPIASSSDEEPPQSTRKLDVRVPADPPNGDSLEPVCNLAVLTKSRRKVVVNGLNHLGEHDKALRTLFFPEQCCVTCGPKHVVAITSHLSASQDPMIHCLDIGCQFDKIYLAGVQSQPYHHCCIILKPQ